MRLRELAREDDFKKQAAANAVGTLVGGFALALIIGGIAVVSRQVSAGRLLLVAGVGGVVVFLCFAGVMVLGLAQLIVRWKDPSWHMDDDDPVFNNPAGVMIVFLVAALWIAAFALVLIVTRLALYGA